MRIAIHRLSKHLARLARNATRAVSRRIALRCRRQEITVELASLERRGHALRVRAQQAQGMEWAFMRKAIRRAHLTKDYGPLHALQDRLGFVRTAARS